MIDFGFGRLLSAARRLIVPSTDIEIPTPEMRFRLSGRALMWQTRKKSGSIYRKPWWINNGAATVGLNYVLNTSFRGTSALSSWYCGLIAGSGFSAVSISDTMASHAGWTEFTSYDESTRQQWSPGAAASGVLINSSVMSFTIASTSTCQGIFIASSSTKSESASTLWCSAVDGSAFTVTDNIVHNVIYELTLTPVS